MKKVTLFSIIKIKSDPYKEFDFSMFKSLYDNLGVLHEFYTPKTPQHNGIVERKN